MVHQRPQSIESKVTTPNECSREVRTPTDPIYGAEGAPPPRGKSTRESPPDMCQETILCSMQKDFAGRGLEPAMNEHFKFIIGRSLGPPVEQQSAGAEAYLLSLSWRWC